MSISSELLVDIENALNHGSCDNRTETLFRVTDLFLGRAAEYTAAQKTIFGDVMCRLMAYVEHHALAEVSRHLAHVSAAPVDVIQTLAWHDNIEVSGPVLHASDVLDDGYLAEIARNKSQAHLHKIAGRPQLSATVTTALVDYGNSEVIHQVAANEGAQFSPAGMSMLVLYADGDDRLTETIVARSDISPRLFHQLLAQATDAVRENLLATARPEQKIVLKRVLDDISAEVGKQRQKPSDYTEALRLVRAFGHDTKRMRSIIAEFSDAQLVAELIAALSLLSGVPILRVDWMFNAPSSFGLMILCRAIGLNWAITQSVILNRPAGSGDHHVTLAEMREHFNNTSIDAAKRLVKGWVELRKSEKPTEASANEVYFVD